jgi:hypothetical protein
VQPITNSPLQQASFQLKPNPISHGYKNNPTTTAVPINNGHCPTTLVPAEVEVVLAFAEAELEVGADEVENTDELDTEALEDVVLGAT